MMKMATREGLPPPAGCWNGSRLAFGGYGGFWQWNSDLLCSRMFLGYMAIYRRKKYVRGATRVEGAPRGVGAPPTSWLPRSFLDVDSMSPGLLSSKNKLPEVSGQFDSV